MSKTNRQNEKAVAETTNKSGKKYEAVLGFNHGEDDTRVDAKTIFNESDLPTDVLTNLLMMGAIKPAE